MNVIPKTVYERNRAELVCFLSEIETKKLTKTKGKINENISRQSWKT